MRGLSLVVASGGHSSSRCTGLSLSQSLLLRSTGSRHAGSVVVAHGPSCSAACGILPDQGSNPHPLHWQADSQPLCHQGSPKIITFVKELVQLHRYLAHLVVLIVLYYSLSPWSPWSCLIAYFPLSFLLRAPLPSLNLKIFSFEYLRQHMTFLISYSFWWWRHLFIFIIYLLFIIYLFLNCSKLSTYCHLALNLPFFF